MRSVSPLTVLLAASLWGCGADDEGESGRVPLEQDMTGSFVDQDFTLSYAIAMSFAPGALTFGETVEEDFGVITSDQPLSCTSDIASDPQEGVYVVIYLKKSVGTHNHHFVEVFRRGPGIHNRWQSNSAEASVATLDTDLITGSVRYEPQGPYEGNDLELLQGNFAAELCDD